MTRPPLILVILRLPVQFIRFILYAVGSLCYLPIYLYCLSLRKFFFHSNFETNQLFYIIFSLPRGLFSLGGFVIGALELSVAYYIVLQCNIVESERALYITLASLTAFALFCFRFGYNLLFNKLKFPQLKSTKEHLMLTVYMIEDLISLLFTGLTIILVFRAKQVFCYKFENNQRKYLRFSAYMLTLSLSDLACVPFWLIVFTLHWRFPYTRRVLKKIPAEYTKKLFLIYQAVSALIDLLYVPLFLIVLLNPFAKGKRLITHMSKLSVIVWRSLIFDEFGNTVYDIPAICVFTAMMASIYEAPLAFTAYKKTLNKVTPFDFEADANELKRINNLEIQTELSEKVHNHINDADETYRPLYSFLFPVILVDLIILACNILLVTSVYGYLIFREKIQIEKLKSSKKEDQAMDLTFTYGEYRRFLYEHIALELDENSYDNSMYSTYPEKLLKEALRLLFLDIPTILITLLVILAPWRLQILFKSAKEAWTQIGNVGKEENKLKLSLHWKAVYCVLEVIKDYLGFTCFWLNLPACWRWTYLFPEIKTILTGPNTFLEKLDAFDSLMFSIFMNATVQDISLLPFAMIFIPFFITCPWQIAPLIRALKSSQLADFNGHRFYIMTYGKTCFCDFLNLIPLTITLVGLTRIKTLFILTSLSNPLSIVQKEAMKVSESSVITQDDHPENTKSLLNPNEKSQSLSLKQKIVSLPQYFTDYEKREKLFKAGRKSCVLFLLDILSFPFIILICTNVATFRKIRFLTKKINEERKGVVEISVYCNYERKIIFHRFDLGFAALVLNLVTALTFILTWFLLWRLPTFFLFMTRRDLRDFLITSQIRDEQKREFYKKKFLKRTGVIVFYCFKHLMIDLLYLPIFISMMTITPWRCVPVFKGIYRYNLESSLGKQIGLQRSLLVNQFRLGLRDIVLLMKSAIIIVTLIRIPFFVSIVLKNRFPNFRTTKGGYTLLKPKDPETKLPLYKCINITFKELLKDLPYIPFAVLIVLIAPWRIFTILSIIASQVTRVPTQDIESKRLVLHSRRPEILKLWGTVIKVDAVILVKTLAVSLPLYRIKNVLKIYIDFLINFRQYQEGQKSLKKEIGLEFSRLVNDLIKLICVLFVLVFVLRIKKMIQRLKAYYVYNKVQKSLRLKQQKIQATDKDQLTLNDLSWDTYGRVCQYLTITDLASLSQVNRKFYHLNQKDYYWEYQYNRSFSGNPVGAVTFKAKCIRLYREQRAKNKDPMTEAQRDAIWGSMYILQDEAVESFKSIPHLLLLPVKLLAWSFSKIFDTSRISFSTVIPFRSPNYADWWRIVITEDLPHIFQFENILTFTSFEDIHKALPYWIFVPVLKYICEIGYFFGYLMCETVQKTSAGDTTVLIFPDPVRYYGIRQAHNEEDLREMPSGPKRTFLYWVQLICVLAYAGSFFYLVDLALTDFYKYFPICSINCFTLFNIYFTPIFLLSRIRPRFFTPIKAITITVDYFTRQLTRFNRFVTRHITRLFTFVSRQLTMLWNYVGRPLFKKIAYIIELLQRNISKLISLITSGIERLITFIIAKIKLMMRSRRYIKILLFITKKCLPHGLTGDILLTIFALVWMWWPCLIPVVLATKIYFIPCGLISMVLTWIGYREIKIVWRSSQTN